MVETGTWSSSLHHEYHLYQDIIYRNNLSTKNTKNNNTKHTQKTLRMSCDSPRIGVAQLLPKGHSNPIPVTLRQICLKTDCRQSGPTSEPPQQNRCVSFMINFCFLSFYLDKCRTYELTGRSRMFSNLL